MENDMQPWFCENHPELEFGHDGCFGCGILEEARIPQLVLQRRHLVQKLNEGRAYRGQIIALLIERIKELEPTVFTKELASSPADALP